MRYQIITTIILTTLAVGCTNTVKSPYCVTNHSSDTPDWIKNNFYCVETTVADGNVTIKSTGLPPYKSYYYGSSSDLYEAIPSGRKGNPNTIKSQNIVMIVPVTPTIITSTASYPSTPGGVAGLSINGVAIFDNAAAPGDTLSTEAQTFDGGDGHPNDSGIYHYHTDPVYYTSNDGTLIGIALDGLPIYGRKESSDGSTPTSVEAVTHAHYGVTKDFSGGTYHYHIINDATAGIYTILGDNYKAKTGSVSN